MGELLDHELDASKIEPFNLKGNFGQAVFSGSQGGPSQSNGGPTESGTSLKLYNETLKPKKGLKPLLKRVDQISPPQMDYLGVAFGLTLPPYNFWHKAGF